MQFNKSITNDNIRFHHIAVIQQMKWKFLFPTRKRILDELPTRSHCAWLLWIYLFACIFTVLFVCLSFSFSNFRFATFPLPLSSHSFPNIFMPEKVFMMFLLLFLADVKWFSAEENVYRCLCASCSFEWAQASCFSLATIICNGLWVSAQSSLSSFPHHVHICAQWCLCFSCVLPYDV